MSILPNIAVIGGSYVGVNTAQQLATKFSGRFQVLLIEKNSHFQHLFAFPRFAVTSKVDTHKAFIPYTPGTFANCPSGSGIVVRAGVTKVDKEEIWLDRKVEVNGQGVEKIPYAYLVIATGTKLTPPSTLPSSDKADGVTYLRNHASKVESSSNIAIIGGGAVGVQMATDIKEVYPEKDVTLIHSREQIMNKFHPQLDGIIKQRCEELGVKLKLGSRVKLPAKGYPTDGSTFNVELLDGSSVSTDFAVIATGQTPQSELIRALSPESIDDAGFVRVRRTLQIHDTNFPNIFAVGDVADTGAHKAARPALRQAPVVVENIQHLANDETLEHYEVAEGPSIHLSLGLTKNIKFINSPGGAPEPKVIWADDGKFDMGIDGVWTRRGGGPNALL
ncbi:putative oxidoreductase [Aureobasidium sp. EXF-3400]|nr:putative oxidoreductase [Aureobasidium sp. EXF-12344]KAI4773629.1 putative oxidoreductase [Aureobasidium sp. EXF-3400]